MKQVTVIGSGVMGHGIAQLVAQANVPVVLTDVYESSLEKATELITANLAMQVEQQAISESEKERTLMTLSTSTDVIQSASNSDLVIEAISEKLDLKHELYEKLEEAISKETIIASNTSTFSLEALTKNVAHPERFIVTHFFNPAQFVPLVEVVKGNKTTEDVAKRVMNFMEQVGKRPILLQKDVPGFIANRLQAALVREAFHLLEEGVADARSIDLAVTEGPGLRWGFSGPLETADFGGLDIWKSVVENLAPELSAKQQVPSFIDAAIENGNLGTKTSKGIYSYSDEVIQSRLVERDEYLLKMSKVRQ
ncbi:3-hydroxyacyl-CoA dehydrogenase family protein [Geomicrobium sp. JSM 1781026]|uniref:3-hydroxyacyl-CoA dehydrogenase family protein n=1 Tax=Geomicrobium sp. JSM 1781026 TaxID=3344580 RepID=UPI0035C24AAD